MTDKINGNEDRQVVYEREVAQSIPAPEFKPDNTPYTQYGNETLNANVLWYQVIQEILVHKTQEQLANEVGTPLTNIMKIMKQNYRKLNFRTGARILGVHCSLYPAQYC